MSTRLQICFALENICGVCLFGCVAYFHSTMSANLYSYLCSGCSVDIRVFFSLIAVIKRCWVAMISWSLGRPQLHLWSWNHSIPGVGELFEALFLIFPHEAIKCMSELDNRLLGKFLSPSRVLILSSVTTSDLSVRFSRQVSCHWLECIGWHILWNDKF